MRTHVLCAISFIFILAAAFEAQATTVMVNPATQESPAVGEILSVGIKVEDVADLYGYDILLSFDNTALSFVEIHEEEFLKQDGTFTVPFLMLGWEEAEATGEFVEFKDVTIDTITKINSVGGLLIGNTRTTGISGINGTGLLMTITFEVLEVKNSVLMLGNDTYPVSLVDSTVDPEDPELGPIETDTADGNITFTPNVPPVAAAGDDLTVRQGETFSLDGSASSDSDGSIASYEWDLGDGNTAEGATVSHTYATAVSYTVTLTVTDDDGDTGTDTLMVNVQEALPPVIREHTDGSPVLSLQAIYDEANTHGHAYIDIWKGEMAIETEMFLEYQIAMFSGNPTFQGGIDLHTLDGVSLRDTGAMDQNGISAHPSADLSEFARDQWYHRIISLEPLSGQTINGATIATESDTHAAGLFRLYVDNIQITDGEHILMLIYMDENVVPISGTETATDANFAGIEGMSGFFASPIGETPVTPAGKLINAWGSIKNGE